MFFWIGFHLLIGALLWIDLYLLQRKSFHFKNALVFSFFWIAMALGFNLFIYFTSGSAIALQFFTAYLIEKSLSIDNLFLFLVVFTTFKIPNDQQHRILFWGILGAIFFRIILILAGISLIREFHWLLYILGFFLIATGIRFACKEGSKKELQESIVLKFLKRVIPLTNKREGGAFMIRERGKWKCTHLFLALLVIECFDVMFALDSIPAVFAVSSDPWIIYTSNIFAILGLRALYFVLVPLLQKLHYLKYGLAILLVFVGCKMLLSDIYPIPLGYSLAVIVGVLGVTLWASLWKRKSAS